MAKLGFASIVTAFVATLAIVGFTAEDASAGKPCATAKPETKFLADACKKGGQDEAKKAMKGFLKGYKKTNPTATCNSCHTKVGGAYPLKPDALQKAKDAGMK
ncbi:MAG: hypothetical protein F9K40_15350 [Kofleriaceae bacterium]|nr:MAG: hypothetical protein F9K40_15350 [Kofleriaceae bacterium]MBZ0233109.1 hypothetical protein [Kofleriaceae bacterium]